MMNDTSFFNNENIPQSSNTLASDSVAPSVPVIPGQLQPFFPTHEDEEVMYAYCTVQYTFINGHVRILT